MRKVYTVELKPGSNEELLPDFDDSFPHITSHAVLWEGYQAPWHWHKAVELFYIESGALEYITPSQRYVFTAGCGGLINSNVLHMALGHSLQEEGSNKIHLFEPVLIAGFPGSRVEENYVLPLTTAPQIEMIVLRAEEAEHQPVLKKLKDSFALPSDTPGYELRIRGILSDIWLELLDIAALRMQQNEKCTSASELTKKILVYIHEHYGQKLTVRMLADAVCISERTCFELFRRNLRTTPMEYINSYRLRMACRLLTQTEKSVTDISGECGMNNSYFCQMFREMTGFTPLEYRRFYQRHQHSLTAEEIMRK